MFASAPITMILLIKIKQITLSAENKAEHASEYEAYFLLILSHSYTSPHPLTSFLLPLADL